MKTEWHIITFFGKSFLFTVKYSLTAPNQFIMNEDKWDLYKVWTLSKCYLAVDFLAYCYTVALKSLMNSCIEVQDVGLYWLAHPRVSQEWSSLNDWLKLPFHASSYTCVENNWKVTEERSTFSYEFIIFKPQAKTRPNLFHWCGLNWKHLRKGCCYFRMSNAQSFFVYAYSLVVVPSDICLAVLSVIYISR